MQFYNVKSLLVLITSTVVSGEKVDSKLKWGGSNDDGTGEIGDDCYRHEFCASGKCTSGTFSSGVCAECFSDDDCEGHGHSLPGIIPEAFCHQADGGHGVCSPWKNGHPIDDNGYPVWLGTEDDPPLMIQRNVHNEGPPTSLVWRFELNNQPGGAETANAFVANATHISIPMNTNLLAGYSMSNQMVEEHESGIVSINFLTNPVSVVTPYPAGGDTSEKYHTLSHEGPLDESRKEAVLADLQGRSTTTQQYAEEGAYRRAVYVAGSIRLTDLGGEIIEAGQDARGLQELRAYVQHVLDGEIEMSADESMDETMSTEADQAFELAASLPSLKSMNQCTHYEEREGLGVNGNGSHFEFPLDSPIVFLKGITEFIPSGYFGLNAGILVVQYDSDANILEFSFKMYQSYRMYPFDRGSPKNGLWVAPVHAQYPVDSADGRTDEFYDLNKDYSFALNGLIRNYNSMPEDYSFFDRSPTGTCDESTMEMIGDAWSTFGEEEDPDVSLLSQAAGMIEGGQDALNLLIYGATCISSYLKADAHEGLVSFGLLELLVYNHMILEADGSDREKSITNTWWDDWDQFYKQQDQVSDIASLY